MAILTDSSQTQFYLGEESTWGTIATTMYAFDITGESLSHNIQNVTSKTITANPDVQDLIQTGAEASGDFSFEMAYGAEFDMVLEHALRGSFSGNDLLAGTEWKQLSLRKVFTNEYGKFVLDYLGARINTLTLNASVDNGIITSTANIMVKSETLRDDYMFYNGTTAPQTWYGRDQALYLRTDTGAIYQWLKDVGGWGSTLTPDFDAAAKWWAGAGAPTILDETLDNAAAVSVGGGTSTKFPITGHPFRVGETVTIAGCVHGGYNADHVITATDANSITAVVGYVGEVFTGAETCKAKKVNDDWYINLTTGAFYKCETGAWSTVKFTIKPTTCTWYAGIIAPTTEGDIDDLYIDVATTSVYQKLDNGTTGTWTKLIEFDRTAVSGYYQGLTITSATNGNKMAIPQLRNVVVLNSDDSALANAHCFKDLTITINNNARNEKGICTDNATWPNLASIGSVYGGRDISVNMTILLSDMELYRKYKNGAEISLQFDMTDGTNKYTFFFPKVKLSEGTTHATGVNTTVEQPLKAVALYDDSTGSSIKITKGTV